MTISDARRVDLTVKVAIAVSLIKSVSESSNLIQYLKEKDLYNDYTEWSAERLRSSLHTILDNLDEEEREWIKQKVNQHKKVKKDA